MMHASIVHEGNDRRVGRRSIELDARHAPTAELGVFHVDRVVRLAEVRT